MQSTQNNDGTMHTDALALQQTRDRLVEQLLAFRTDEGYWTGRLSSSALATATAVFALAMVDADRYEAPIHAGLDWLRDHQNRDGGWGDTPLNQSHLSTTLLAWSALAVASHPSLYEKTMATAEAWLRRQIGPLDTPSIVKAISDIYGGDRTFAVPILTLSALAGRIGQGQDVWRHIPALPFELAALPRGLFRFLRLGVVSYALPALIAIGQLHAHVRPARNPLTRWIRRALRGRVLRILERIQPTNGGFLEAVPLTAFVVMSLAESDLCDHPSVEQGVAFLTHSMRADGAWPIDTDLATWVTTLSIRALSGGVDPGPLSPSDRKTLTDWLLSQQYRRVHPYTGAAPGGWAWTNKPGAVPDVDDTAGALVALHRLGDGHLDERQSRAAVHAGLKWLLGLQNRDGGMPTFCRGWGKLPFDRSCADLTAHALAAWGCWINECPVFLQRRIGRAMEHALAWLEEHQRPDGAWLCLWFGNEHAADQKNPVYGTARVLSHLSLMPEEFIEPNRGLLERGAQWLLSMQKPDGGWGGDEQAPASIEETALALDALVSVAPLLGDDHVPNATLTRAAEWIAHQTRDGTEHAPSPIGLYFASLWYYERLYPIIFAAGALRRLTQWSRRVQDSAEDADVF